MNQEREQLLELLRCSLWDNTPSQELLQSDVDWQALITNAKKQSVMGSIYTQIEQFDKRPSKAVMMRLHTLTTLNRKMYLQQFQILEIITKRLQAGGIERPVLLKGIGVSSNYIDPGVRQCGDIDIYVGKRHYDAACEMAASWSESVVESDSKSHKHFHFHFNGIPIEIHRIVISSNNITRNSSKFSAWCIENLEGEGLRKQTIQGVDVYLPPYNFDAIYIFYHAWNHFCTYGISFRQICDWCRFLVVYRDKIDHKKLEADLEFFGLVRPWSYFAATATKLLGLDPQVLVSFDPSKEWHTDKVSERIWHGGNFGAYSDKNAMGENENVLRRKTINFFSLFHSFGFLYSIDKPYAINFLFRAPLNSIKANIMQLYYILTNK